MDIANFFGARSHAKLEVVLLKKVTDQKFMRSISRMFKSGILSNGELAVSEEGVAQGSLCSPILSNIYAHEVIDWIAPGK